MPFQLNFLLFVYLFLNFFLKFPLFEQPSRTLSNSFPHPLITKPWPISTTDKADLRTTIKLFARSRKLLTPEETSLRASLMARYLPLGPSDAPCPVETSTAHGDSFFETATFTTVIVKASWICVLASDHAYRGLRPNLTPEMFTWAQISSLTPVSRHPLVSPLPATAKLGFWLKGLASKLGPLSFMRPKPNNCDPTLNRKKSRSVLSLPLSISSQCLGWLFALDGRRHQPRKKSPSLLWDCNIFMRTLEVVSYRAIQQPQLGIVSSLFLLQPSRTMVNYSRKKFGLLFRTPLLPVTEKNRTRSSSTSQCIKPAIREAKYPFSTSQDLLIVTISKIPEPFVEVSLTHRVLACGMLLVSLCFRVYMNLSLKFIAYPIFLMYVWKTLLQNFVSVASPMG